LEKRPARSPAFLSKRLSVTICEMGSAVDCFGLEPFLKLMNDPLYK
jgi:hypothetical protein